MASFVTNRILDLQELAVFWALEPPSMNKTRFGFWLHGELVDIFESGLLKESDLVDFNTVVKILLEQIFPQSIEGDDDE